MKTVYIVIRNTCLFLPMVVNPSKCPCCYGRVFHHILHLCPEVEQLSKVVHISCNFAKKTAIFICPASQMLLHNLLVEGHDQRNESKGLYLK